MRARWFRSATCAVALLLASSTAHAFVGKGDRTPSRLAAERPRVLDAATPRRAQATFTALAGQGWRASWHRDTGVPAWLWGSHVAVPGAIADAAVAEQAARAFLAAHAGVLAPGASPGDFVLATNRRDGRIRTVAFFQTWRGLRVVGGQLGFVFMNDRLFAVRSAAWPDVRATASGRASPAVQRDRARAWLAAETGVQAAVTARGERVVVPMVDAAVAGGLTYRIADLFDARAVRGHERWEVYVGDDGVPLGRRSTIMYATGTLAFDVGDRHANGPRTHVPAPALDVIIDGSVATTDDAGTFAWAGMEPTTVEPSLAGTYVRIIDQAGPLATASLTAQPDATVVWSRASDELEDAQLSTFIYASRGKAKAREINPSVVAWLDTQLDFYVNENGSCNAYSTGDDVHLFRASAACENTGRVGDVVVHELGHSLHNHSVIAGMGAFESHLSEGLADFFAASVTGDPAVGRGFFKTDEPLRHIDPIGSERVYPLDYDFDPHVSGLIIAGALWDLRKALVAELGEAAGIARVEEIFTGIMQRADDIGVTFTAALIADDDDGDLGNGTPHYCAIERAFGTHGLVPGYQATTVTPPVVSGLDLSVTATTPTGTACPPATVASMTIRWRTNDGPWSELPLLAHGDGTWTGALPPPAGPTLLAYALDVAFDDGSLRRFPDNPADPQYQLFVGEVTPLWCEPMDTDPQWMQSGNRGREWEWAAAGAAPSSPDPATAYTGTHVLGTDITGDGAYRPNMMTSITTPPLPIAAFERVRLHYRRWLTTEDALYDRATIRANGEPVWENARSPGGTLDHVDREWRFHDVDLTPHVADGTLELRWELASDFAKELGGWTLDDVCVVGITKLARCGDGQLDDGEQCDDGNTDDDDGCSAACTDEITAGGGGCCAGTRDARGSLVLGAGVLLVLRRRRSARGGTASR